MCCKSTPPSDTLMNWCKEKNSVRGQLLWPRCYLKPLSSPPQAWVPDIPSQEDASQGKPIPQAQPLHPTQREEPSRNWSHGQTQAPVPQALQPSKSSGQGLMGLKHTIDWATHSLLVCQLVKHLRPHPICRSLHPTKHPQWQDQRQPQPVFTRSQKLTKRRTPEG